MGYTGEAINVTLEDQERGNSTHGVKVDVGTDVRVFGTVEGRGVRTKQGGGRPAEGQQHAWCVKVDVGTDVRVFDTGGGRGVRTKQGGGRPAEGRQQEWRLNVGVDNHVFGSLLGHLVTVTVLSLETEGTCILFQGVDDDNQKKKNEEKEEEKEEEMDEET